LGADQLPSAGGEGVRAVAAVSECARGKDLAGGGRELGSAIESNDCGAVDRKVQCFAHPDVVERRERGVELEEVGGGDGGAVQLPGCVGSERLQ
jgi:hypothetical protein